MTRVEGVTGDWSGVVASANGSFVVAVERGDITSPTPTGSIWIYSGKSLSQVNDYCTARIAEGECGCCAFNQCLIVTCVLTGSNG